MLEFKVGSFVSDKTFRNEEIVLYGRGEIGLRGRNLVFENCRIDARKADVQHVLLNNNQIKMVDTTVLGGRVSCVCVQDAEVFISGLRVGQMKIDGSGTGYGLLLENCRGFVENVRPSGKFLRHLVTVVQNSGPLIFNNLKVPPSLGFAALDLHGRGDIGVTGIRIVGRINIGNSTHKIGSKKAFLFRSFGSVWLGLNSDFHSLNSALKVVNEAKEDPQVGVVDSPDVSRRV